MKEIEIDLKGVDISQETAQEMSRLLAREGNQECTVIARRNRQQNSCSPCALGGDLNGRPGWEVYGETHGGRLKVSINQGDYVFIWT